MNEKIVNGFCGHGLLPEDVTESGGYLSLLQRGQQLAATLAARRCISVRRCLVLVVWQSADAYRPGSAGGVSPAQMCMAYAWARADNNTMSPSLCDTQTHVGAHEKPHRSAATESASVLVGTTNAEHTGMRCHTGAHVAVRQLSTT
ncbi:hypothetical protein [Paraburkholderia sp. 2C]